MNSLDLLQQQPLASINMHEDRDTLIIRAFTAIFLIVIALLEYIGVFGQLFSGSV